MPPGALESNLSHAASNPDPNNHDPGGTTTGGAATSASSGPPPYDPGYTTPFDIPVPQPYVGGFNLRYNENQELFEYVCQQANYAHELMVGGESRTVSRSSPIVP